MLLGVAKGDGVAGACGGVAVVAVPTPSTVVAVRNARTCTTVTALLYLGRKRVLAGRCIFPGWNAPTMIVAGGGATTATASLSILFKIANLFNFWKFQRLAKYLASSIVTD